MRKDANALPVRFRFRGAAPASVLNAASITVSSLRSMTMRSARLRGRLLRQSTGAKDLRFGRALRMLPGARLAHVFAVLKLFVGAIFLALPWHLALVALVALVALWQWPARELWTTRTLSGPGATNRATRPVVLRPGH